MKGRMFIAALALGAMMTCTLVTAHAADYRKEVKMDYSTTNFEMVNAIITDYNTFQVTNPIAFIVPVIDYFLETSVTYLKPENDGKLDNRSVNGILNDRREKERISNYPIS